MGNNYFKKYYEEDEVNVVEITQIRLKFYCLLSKFQEKSILYCYKKGKKRMVCVVS